MSAMRRPASTPIAPMQHRLTAVGRMRSRLANFFRTSRPWFVCIIATTLLAAAEPGAAQSLAQRIAAAGPDAAVSFSYESREGVCGDGRNVWIVRDGTAHQIGHRYGGGERECLTGPVRLELTREAWRVTKAQATVGVYAPTEGIDLGPVPAAAAVEYILGEGVRRSDGRAADHIIFAATLAAAESWPGLLAIAHDTSATRSARRTAIFWLGQAAGERAAEGLTSLIGDGSEELEVRKHAVFALSQTRSTESIDLLIGIARSNPEPEIRRAAIFWLSQTRDPKAIAFFEEVLRG